jgi:ankyrin repeat protein
MGSYGHYPYPLNTKGNPIDTPEWRNPDDIEAHAPKKHEKAAPDCDLFKAIRQFDENGMGGVEAALQGGADVNTKDKFGFTALHLAIKNKKGEVAKRLIEVEGIDLDARTNKGFTPMLIAAWKGELELVQKLITAGANMKLRDSAGRNVWGVAHDWHHEEILELLKRNDFHFQEGDVLAFPPAPKWRPDQREAATKQ